MQQKKVSVPVPYSKCVFHRVGGDGGSSQGQDIALALPLPLISLAEVVSASAYTRSPKQPKSYKIMKKSAPFCSGILVKFTESNRIVVFDKHVCVSGSSICTAYLPYAAVIPSETHRQRV